MSMGIAIKNAILMVLIILIIHFLIKNFLIEKFNFNTPTINTHNMCTLNKTPELQINEPYPFNNLKSNDICENKRNDSSRDELLQFVFGEENGELDNYFKEKSISNPVHNLTDNSLQESCKKQNFNHMPVSTTCDRNMDNLTWGQEKVVDKDCDLDQELSGVMLLKTYKEENQMNGDNLFDSNLQAFDDFSNNYSKYT